MLLGEGYIEPSGVLSCSESHPGVMGMYLAPASPRWGAPPTLGSMDPQDCYQGGFQSTFFLQ